MSVLGAHVQALLKPSGVQHWLKGTSTPPEVARHTKALLTLENLHVGSSSCNSTRLLREHWQIAGPCQVPYSTLTASHTLPDQLTMEMVLDRTLRLA